MLQKVGPIIFFLLVYLVGAAGVETIFWMTKFEKWVTKVSISHSNLIIPLELLLRVVWVSSDVSLVEM